tara:strand:+ start:60 stop:641 length:582 start_codon:yes stop_codon:yes gene_type:complete
MGKTKTQLQTSWGTPLSDLSLGNRLKLMLSGNIQGVDEKTGKVLWKNNYRKTVDSVKTGLIDPVVDGGRFALSILKMKPLTVSKEKQKQIDAMAKAQNEAIENNTIDVAGSKRYGETLTIPQVRQRDKEAKIEKDNPGVLSTNKKIDDLHQKSTPITEETTKEDISEVKTSNELKINKPKTKGQLGLTFDSYE